MRRLEGWPERLADAIRAASERPFSLGTWDCGHFAVECCIAVTGVDVGAPWRGTYEGAVGLARLYAELGVRDLVGWADHVIGVRRPVNLARRGDWVLSPEGEEPALGVCEGQAAVFLDPEVGLSWRKTLSCRLCWQIGE